MKTSLPVKIAVLTFLIGMGALLDWLFISRISPRPEQSISNGSELTVREPNDPLEAKMLEASEDEMPDLSFCRLMENPVPFEGKIIRLTGIYGWSGHGAYFTDAGCDGESNLTWVETSNRLSLDVDHQRMAETLEKLKNQPQALAVRITAVGIFERNPPPPIDEDGMQMRTDALSDNARYKFQLIRIEKTELPY